MSSLDKKHTLSSEITEVQCTSQAHARHLKSHLRKPRRILWLFFPRITVSCHVQLSARSFYHVSNSNLVEKVKTFWPPFSYNFHQQISTFHISTNWRHAQILEQSSLDCCIHILNDFYNKYILHNNWRIIKLFWYVRGLFLSKSVKTQFISHAKIQMMKISCITTQHRNARNPRNSFSRV